jgi:hypothetical protein
MVLLPKFDGGQRQPSIWHINNQPRIRAKDALPSGLQHFQGPVIGIVATVPRDKGL